jgi:hypothetical protein
MDLQSKRHIWPQSMRQGRSQTMNALLQSTKERYAVIQLSSTSGPPERLILAYPDEGTLRALIAEPSILGVGFGSREEAVSTSNAALKKPATPSPTNRLESAPIGQHHTHSGARATKWSSFLSLGRMGSGIVQCAFAAAMCIFYSQNIVSATIRLVLAGSV